MEYGKNDYVFTGGAVERAVRMVLEHRSEWAAICSIAGEVRLFVGDVAQVGSAG